MAVSTTTPPRHASTTSYDSTSKHNFISSAGSPPSKSYASTSPSKASSTYQKHARGYSLTAAGLIRNSLPSQSSSISSSSNNTRILSDVTNSIYHHSEAGPLPSRTSPPHAPPVYVMSNIQISNDVECAAFLDERIKKNIPPTFPLTPKSLTGSTRLDRGNPTFSLAPTKFANTGMFAQTNLSPGSLILSEPPILLIPPTDIIGHVMPQSHLLQRLVERLDISTRKRFLALVNSFHVNVCDEFEGIMRSNGLEIELSVGQGENDELVPHRAIFLTTSRCNHSCAPNAMWSWDPTTFHLSLLTTRPIPKNTEITIPYIDCTLPREERRVLLRSLYHFDCRCKVCALDPRSIAKSDLNRKELHTRTQQGLIVPSFETWCSDTTLSDDLLISSYQREMVLRECEGLELLDYRKNIDAVAMCYGALGNEGMFKYWTSRARELRNDQELEKRQVLDIWLENPRLFPVWGLKNSRTKM